MTTPVHLKDMNHFILVALNLDDNSIYETFKRYNKNSLGRNLGYNHSKILIICTNICDINN